MNRLLMPEQRTQPDWLPIAGLVAVLTLLAALTGGCGNGMQRIDARVDALLKDSSDRLGPETDAPTIAGRYDPRPDRRDRARITDGRPDTTNPALEELQLRIMDESDDVIQRLAGYVDDREDAMELDMPAALRFAMLNSPEVRTAQEEFVLSGLRLLIEQHRWGPRFFDEVRAEVVSQGDDGLFETSLRLVNEFRVTQRLPYGGEVSARALASATESLHSQVSARGSQSAEIILAANVPLLRGAGMAAREDIIQTQRNMVYAARRYERFRRQFVFDIARDYLDLVVQLQNIVNAERQVSSFEMLERRERALVEAGRQTPFFADRAAQNTNFARDRLNTQLERYRLSEERFKVRIGMPVEIAIEIPAVSLDLPTPRVSLDRAVEQAFLYRLDMQTRRDQLDDSRRSLDNARNQLLGDLRLAGQINMPTDSDQRRAGLSFDPDSSDLRASVTYGLPLDREIERISLRQAQISLERDLREFERFRDNMAVQVRASVRNIDRALFSLQLQEEDIRIAERRQASIDAAPDRATARDRSEAVDDLLRAQDQRDAARRDLQVAILGFLLDTGQLRVAADGTILLPTFITENDAETVEKQNQAADQLPEPANSARSDSENIS